uniref:CUB domain-containing protein n=1 Tax=Panagrellus redivivus TaxID=6233 RepID=A0A7E4W7Z2_PANRE
MTDGHVKRPSLLAVLTVDSLSDFHFSQNGSCFIPKCGGYSKSPSLSLLFGAKACRIDLSIQGAFQRQFAVIVDAATTIAQFEKVIISTSGSSIWGDCYENVGSDSYIFGLKRMGQSTCFRCISLLLKTPNVLQSLHQNESICHDTISEAKQACFDTSIIGPGDGTFLYRSEAVESVSCGLEGTFSFTYNRLNHPNTTCGTESLAKVSNCEQSDTLNFDFRNCSFPHFEQKLQCLGTWQDKDTGRFVAFYNPELRQHRCGKLVPNKAGSALSISDDANCDRMPAALEKYTLFEKNTTYSFAPCRFPEWIQGEYDGLSVRHEHMRHHLSNAPALTSVCVEVDNEKILVFSETSCGEPLGYHCLWFRSRSNSVLEYRTTAVSAQSMDMCRHESDFNASAWTTLVSRSPRRTPCAYFGTYSTPKEMRTVDCYNMTVDCATRDKFKLIAYHCSTGAVYDVRSYDCYGTWKEDEHLFVYTKTDDSLAENTCMISQQQNDLLYMAILGNHCNRKFNFSENADSTLVFRRDDECTKKLRAVAASPESHETTTSGVRRFAPKMREKAPGSDGRASSTTPVPTSSAAMGRGCFMITLLFFGVMILL